MKWLAAFSGVAGLRLERLSKNSGYSEHYVWQAGSNREPGVIDILFSIREVLSRGQSERGPLLYQALLAQT